ncbi:methyl viologen-reducing hydrogenase [Geomonas paludis]|uniref:Methyl viologen-reducing hydrogenase n=1 Tax=Geomonas paludis TaxID=2740185 RepID=A0A6V8MZ93_9BACT|nr:methyl viologen-reducing hydrogenase [Geomonas paludis]UPU36904.1 methyl viologen-reducing hydrogenase [Geomonas paludis]GFO65575.1 methyl viologen-reducing hydrogenase [Geomonas paludis]
MGEVTVNTEWLSDCSGCHVAIVDLHEKILSVLEAVRIQRCPVLTDIKDYPPATVGLVSGAIRNEHDRQAALEMRKACDLVIAWGSCAVFGGPAGAGNIHTPDEIAAAVYLENKTTVPAPPPSKMVSPLESQVSPLDSVVEVDLYLPGCPPHPAFVFEALIALVEGRQPEVNGRSVCAKCKRKMEKTGVETLRSHFEGVPDPERCFLSQGYTCLGSVTIDRCLAPCPGNGVPCTGCAGATMQILTEPNRDIRTEIADRMSRLTRIGRDEIVRSLERSAKSHYSYTMATQMIGNKPTFHIRKWIEEEQADFEAGGEA